MGTIGKMITSARGGVSSKIVIGSISYLLIVGAIITMMFLKPDFPGISDLVSVSLITSSSLLGLTTVENVSTKLK